MYLLVYHAYCTNVAKTIQSPRVLTTNKATRNKLVAFQALHKYFNNPQVKECLALDCVIRENVNSHHYSSSDFAKLKGSVYAFCLLWLRQEKEWFESAKMPRNSKCLIMSIYDLWLLYGLHRLKLFFIHTLFNALLTERKLEYCYKIKRKETAKQLNEWEMKNSWIGFYKDSVL